MGRNSRTLVRTFVFALVLPWVWSSTQAQNEIGEAVPTDREVATCGDRELTLFRRWSDIAGKSDAASVREKETKAEILNAEVGDGRKIGVIRLRAAGDSPSGRFVLVIPGNAWLAEHFLPYATEFAGAGLDVYLADFRGYGLSRPGVPTMSAIIQDSRDLLAWIRTQRTYSDAYLYAFSFGGVVALNAFPDPAQFTRIVLDAVPSSPANLLGLTCTPSYESIEHVPAACTNVVMIHGKSDWVVRRAAAQPLLDKMQVCGAFLMTDKRRGHPFQIEWSSTRKKRLADVIASFQISAHANPSTS